MRTTEAILTDIKRIQRKRAKLWPSPDRCIDPLRNMTLARQLDDLKHELKAMENAGSDAPGETEPKTK